MMRTNYCGELNRSHVGQNVTLSGWVHRVRNLGRFIFMQIRDREGVVQVFFANQQGYGNGRNRSVSEKCVSL